MHIADAPLVSSHTYAPSTLSPMLVYSLMCSRFVVIFVGSICRTRLDTLSENTRELRAPCHASDFDLSSPARPDDSGPKPQ